MSLIKINNRSSEDNAIHGRRNIFINSGFLVSQRGDYTSAAAISSGGRQITVDRWTVDFDGQPSTFQIADETVEGKPRRVAKQVITAAGSGNYFHVMQQIECEQWMVGQTFTISGWVKTNVSGQKIRVCDDAGCHLIGSAITADGTWQRIEVTHTLPTNEIVGNSFQVHPAFGNHSTTSVGDYLHWSEFQMELGTKATPFEHRTYGEELRLCQRYFERFAGCNTHAGLYNGSDYIGQLFYKVTKRSRPTLSNASGSYTSLFNSSGGDLGGTDNMYFTGGNGNYLIKVDIDAEF